MKCIKKLLALAAVLVIGCAASFAYDPELMVGPEFVANLTRKDFSKDMDKKGEAFAKDFMNKMCKEMDDLNVTLLEVTKVKSSEITDEVIEMHQCIEDALPSDVRKNDSFSTYAFRKIDGNRGRADGWLVVTHYLAEDNIMSYIYYFKIEIDFENIDYESLFEELLGDYEYDCD